MSDDYVIAVVPPEHLLAAWLIAKPGITEALNNSHNETTIEQIEREIFNGTWHLWAVLCGDNPVGFAVTEVIPGAGGDWINIPFAWSDPAHRVVPLFMDHIYTVAAGLDMKGVKVVSSRPGFGRVLGHMGYKPRFVEYVREC